MRNKTKRVVRIVSGCALLGAGTVMLVIPGPGVLTMAVGLGLLAEEFAWAKSALDRLKGGAKTVLSAVRGKGRTS